MTHLPVQITHLDSIPIDDFDRPDAGTGEIERERAPETARTDDEDARGAERALSVDTKAIEREVSSVAFTRRARVVGVGIGIERGRPRASTAVRHRRLSRTAVRETVGRCDARQTDKSCACVCCAWILQKASPHINND